MLNRRYLRIKVMQTLYAFFQTKNSDLNRCEKELFQGIEKIYDLYLYLVTLLIEIQELAENTSEDNKSKRLPSKNDLNPNKKFIDNQLLKQLSVNAHLKREVSKRKISWQEEPELIKKILNNIKASKEYEEYMASSDVCYKSDNDFIVEVFKKYISEFEFLHHFFEEKSIYWVDDLRLVNMMVIKYLGSFTESSDADFSLMSLYKDTEEDQKFIVDLLRKTIINNQETEKLIGDKTKNWEVERIAMMDILLMKMAITELLNFPSIPVKVTLNEYIEISKLYSTPKSKIFINGILDKIVLDLKEQQQIKKVGRGLME